MHTIWSNCMIWWCRWLEFGSPTGRRSGPDLAARSFVTVLTIDPATSTTGIYYLYTIDLLYCSKSWLDPCISLHYNLFSSSPYQSTHSNPGWKRNFRASSRPLPLGSFWAKIHTHSHIYPAVNHTCSRESQANGTTFKLFSIYRSHHILQRLVWNYQPTLRHQFLDLWLWGWSKSLPTTAPWYSCPRRRKSWKAIVTTRSIWGRVSANLSFMWWKDGFISSRKVSNKRTHVWYEPAGKTKKEHFPTRPLKCHHFGLLLKHLRGMNPATTNSNECSPTQ